MARKKKDNTLLYLVGAGGAAYYLANQKREVVIGGQKVSSIFKKYGIVEGIDYIIDHVDAWPEDPASPSYAKTKQLAQSVWEKTLELSARSRVLFKQVAAKIGKISYITMFAGGSQPGTALKSMLLDLEKVEVSKEQELIEYFKVGGGVSRYKVGIKKLLRVTQANHEFVNQYKDSWVSSLIGVVESVGEALDDIWSAIKGLGSIVITFLKYAPYIILGVGGIWAYNNFIKESA